MRRIRSKDRSLSLISILIVGAFLSTAIGAAIFIPCEASAATGTVAPAYTIYKDASGYTCAKNGVTLNIDYRDTNSRTVIQKAIDKTTGGSILIKAGSYNIPSNIYTSVTSITGEGNSTILKVSGPVSSAVILVTNSYYKMDGTRATSSRPTGITISNLQIDGSAAARLTGTMEGIGFINVLNSQVSRVYVHDLMGGQGVYMSNSQYCTVKDSWIYNIGDNAEANYGSGIAFGEASSTKVACSHITIDNCYISNASMSSIDLEPANNVTITNCVFRDAASWRDYRTPVITMYQVSGYAPNDYVTVSGCNVYGFFNEFIILTPSSHSTVKDNVVTYTAGSCTPIYVTNSQYDTITGNRLTTSASQPIHLVGCSYYTVSGNTIVAIGAVTVPNVPTGLTALAGNGQVALNWIAPAINGGAAIDYYVVYQNGVDVKHVTGTSFIATGLVNGQSYSFTVAAHNSAGIGTKTSAIGSTPLTVPSVPTSLTAIPGNGQVALNWIAPANNGGSAIDYYIVYQGGADVAHVASVSTTITGLVNGQSYSFTVAAHNSAGIGVQTSIVGATPLTIPGAATGLVVSAGNGQVTLNWIAPANNGGSAIDYYVVYQNGVDVRHVSGLSFIATGLTNGQSYSFTIAAHNSAGIGAQTSPVSSIPQTTPGVPTGLVASAGNGQVALNWIAPSINGGAAIDYYIIYQNGVDVKHVIGVSYTVTGLTNGLSYSFTVAAHNSAGASAQTTAVSSMPATIPGVPNGLTAIPGNAQTALNWTAPSSNGGAITDYYVVYQDGTDVKHVTGTSYTVTGLTNGQSYSFGVAAHNIAGIGARSLSVSSVPFSVPGNPTGLTAGAGNGQVSLAWAAPSSNGGMAIDYYVVYQNGVDVRHVAGMSIVLTGLANGQAYSFTIAAHNPAGFGSQTSSVVSTPLTIPGVPTGLTAVAGIGQVTLNWTAPSSNGGGAIDYYVVYQNGVDVKHVTGLSFIATGLTNGQSYTFKIAGHNDAGIGAQTSPVSSIPAVAPVIPVGWGTTKLLETTAGDASTSQVAVSTNGNAIAVWQQYDGAHYNIYARIYSSGAWGTMSLIETLDGSADSPQVAMDSTGNAMVVWRQYDGTYYSLYANRYAAGVWGTAKLMETANGDVQTPQVAMDNNGNAIAVWTQYDGTYYSTYANRYTSGAWGTAKLLETTTGNTQTPQIAMDGSGNAMVVWVQLDNVWRLSIYASKYTNAVGWGAVKLLETGGVDALTPQVAVDNNGNAFAVWTQGGSIYANRYSAGAWGTAKLMETSTVWATSPQVAMDNNGNAIVIWTQGGSIYANRYSAGAWGTAALLNTSAGWGINPQVAMDSKGNAVAVWAQGGSIYANRYSAGAWGTAQLIETGASDAYLPQVAMDASGNAIAVWQQNDGSRLSIYGNVYAKA